MMPVFYVNHVGVLTELLFDGGSMVVNSRGGVVDELNYFEEDFRIYDATDVLNNTTQPTHDFNSIILDDAVKYPRIHNALVMGIRSYFKKLGFTKAVLGSSGGIDSAVVLALATEALGNENVQAVLMPSEFSSKHSIDDALVLGKNLGVNCFFIPINSIYDSSIKTLKPFFNNMQFDLTE